ncbi:MAG: hypothetical protein M1840_007273 [Geoglossum simile]|nr:MAG: hypothetical protein M1840_007273 [Geoglossum simile]
MSGLEVAGVALAVPAIVAQLLKVSKEGYELFQNAQAVPKDVQRQLHSMGSPPPQYRLVLQTLVMIAGVFAEVRQLEEKYGISRVAEDEPAAARVELTEGNPAGKDRFFAKFVNKVQHLLSRPKPASDDIHPTPEKSSAPASFSTSVETGLVPASLSMPGKAVWHVAEGLGELELDNQIPGLAECVQKMAAKVEEYENTIPSLRKYQWAYSSGEKLLLLVTDLETYISYLQVLTKGPFSRLNIVVPIDEFHVARNLPFAQLGNFSGRGDTLEEMKNFLSPTLLEKGRLCDRTVVVLQGMGGIGKSQIALEYLYRNQGDYSAVFWIDATNPNTVKESGREIMESLIAHYAKRHPGGTNFADVAIDLCIPGQITSEGVLSD